MKKFSKQKRRRRRRMTSITIPSKGLRTAWSPRTQSFPVGSGLVQDGFPAQVTLTEYVSSSVDYSILREEFHRHVESQQASMRLLWDEIGKLKKPSVLKEQEDKTQFLMKKVRELEDERKDDRNKANARLDSLAESYEALHKKYVKQSVKLKWHKEALELLNQALQETRDALDFLPGNLTFLEAKQHFLDVLAHGGGAAAVDCEPRVGGEPEEGAVDRELHQDGLPEGWDKPGPADEGAEEQEPEEGSGEGDEEASLHPDKRDEEEDDLEDIPPIEWDSDEDFKYNQKLVREYIQEVKEDALREIGCGVGRTVPISKGGYKSVCGGWELSDNFLNDYP